MRYHCATTIVRNRPVKKLLLFILLTAVASVARPFDLVVTGGYQFNTDFEFSTGGAPVNPPPPAQSGDDVELEQGVVYGLAGDFVFNRNPNQRIGFFVSHQQTDFDDNAGLADTGLDVTHIHFTAMSYYPQGKMEPFVIAGVGAGIFSPEDSTLRDVTRFSMQIGAGTNYQLAKSVLLRFDVRWMPTFMDSDGAVFCDGACTILVKSDAYNQFQVNTGLLFRF